MSQSAFSDQARRLAHNFSWLSMQEAVIRVIGLATAIYLARVLSPENYGTLGLTLAIMGFAAVLVKAGSGSRATRMTARDHEAVPEVFAEICGLRLTIAAIVMVLLVGFSGIFASVFSIPVELLRLSSLLLIPPALAVAWAFKGLDQMQVTATGDMMEKCLTFIGLLLLVHGVGQDVLWAPVVELLASLLVVAWMYQRLRQRFPVLRIEFRVRAWPHIAHEALPLSLASMLSSVYLHGGVLLLGVFASAPVAAQFLVAQKMMLTLALLVQVVNKASFPSISRLVHRDAPAAVQLTMQLLRYYLFITVPMFLVVVFHARDLLALLFGPDYADAGPVLIALLAALPFIAVSSSLQTLLMAIPRPMAALHARIAGAAALLLVSFWLIPKQGALGAAYALIAGELCSCLVYGLSVKRATGGLPWETRFLAPLVAGALAAMFYHLVFDWSLWLKLPMAALLYVGPALLMKAVSLKEMKHLPALLFTSVKKGSGSHSVP